jgi:broad specificity phosphatase PhoE
MEILDERKDEARKLEKEAEAIVREKAAEPARELKDRATRKISDIAQEHKTNIIGNISDLTRK